MTIRSIRLTVAAGRGTSTIVDTARWRSRAKGISSTVMILGTAIGLALPAQALEVDKVQLALRDSGGASCPRNATATVWVHTNGPGTVQVRIRNRSGGVTGAATAQAAKGSGGNYLATVKNLFKITTEVDIQYQAEVVGQEKVSNWVPFKATCGPQVRTKTTTTSSSGPDVIKLAGNHKPGVRTTTTTTKSSGGPRVKKSTDVVPLTKPANNAGAKQDICHNYYVTGDQASGASRSKAEERARAKWSTKAVAVKGGRWGSWNIAHSKSYICGRAGLYYCQAKAVPCLVRKSGTGTNQKPIN